MGSIICSRWRVLRFELNARPTNSRHNVGRCYFCEQRLIFRKVRGFMTKQAGNRGLGRQKGTPNKLTKTLKEMLIASLDDVGGREYFKRQAEENPNAYMTLIGKLIPNELKAEIDAKTDSTLTINIMKYGDYNTTE